MKLLRLLVILLALPLFSCDDSNDFVFPSSQEMTQTQAYFYHTLDGESFRITPTITNTFIFSAPSGSDFGVRRLEDAGINIKRACFSGEYLDNNGSAHGSWIIAEVAADNVASIGELRKLTEPAGIRIAPVFGHDINSCKAATHFFLIRTKADGRHAFLDFIENKGMLYDKISDNLFGVYAPYDSDGILASADFLPLEFIEATEPVFSDTYGRLFSPSYPF